jgi:transcriptional regulator GlxA family with amidase domain
MPVKPPATVAIVTLPEVTASVVFGMYDMFMSAGRDWGLVVDGRPGAALLAPQLVAREASPFTASNGVVIHPAASMRQTAVPQVVCVPELFVAPDDPIDGRFAAEVEFLQRCHAGGAIIATACSGALLLAEAGLLDGRDATTHWAYCDVLQRRYPKVRVHSQRALVVTGDEQRLIMAGGGTTWLDLALYLIARLAGAESAMQVARLNLIDWHSMGQQPFARLARSRQTEDAVIARCQSWIAENYASPAPVAQMTRLSGLADRSFTRRFSQATGMSPLEYVHTLRLEEAKQMLETGEQPVEGIANEVGYEDAAFFSRLFRRKVGLTPVQYRRRFGNLRRSLTSGTH